MKLTLQPIRVYCMHHVCSKFDAESMNECDWMQIDEFKSKVCSMQRDGIKFVSMKIAYQHISEDWIRCRKYAVITFDDGCASLKEILPWLEDRNIPTVLFINGKYLDGKSYRNNPKEQYLTKEELFALASPLIEIGSHGWEHVRVTEQTVEEFEKSSQKNIDLLSKHPRYIPFYAYTWGQHAAETDAYLQSRGITPIYMDGIENYKETDKIHRELIDK